MSRSRTSTTSKSLDRAIASSVRMAIQPTPQSNSMRLTILEQRAQIEDLLEDSPSRKDTFSQKVSTAYQRALIKAEL